MYDITVVVICCLDLVKIFYTGIDMTTINLENNQFQVHLDHGDLLVTLELLRKLHKS